MIKTFEQYNEIDPYGEEQWVDVHYSDDTITNNIINRLMNMGLESVKDINVSKLKKVGKKRMYFVFDPDEPHGIFEARCGGEAIALCTIHEGILDFLWYCDYKFIPDEMVQIRKEQIEEDNDKYCPIFKMEDVLK